MPAYAYIYSVTDSRLSYVQQPTLYCIYVHANHVVLSRVLFGVLRTSHVLNPANTGAVLGFLSGASSRLTGTYEPHLHPRHVCPPCRSPAHRSIFSRSLPPLISYFVPCPRPYIFFLFCGHPCFLLRICATLRRRYQCVLILPMGTLPFFFSDKTARARSQPTVSCLRRLQRSWRTKRKLLSRANQSLSRSSRTLVFGRYVFPFFFA